MIKVIKSPEHQAKITAAMKGRKVTWMPKIVANREKNLTIEAKEKRANAARTASIVCHQRINAEAKLLEEQGYTVIPIAEVIPDIIALKDGKLYAFEIEYGTPNYQKYNKNNYRDRFDDVIWILRKK